MRGHMGVEIGMANDFLVDFDFLGKPEVIGNLDHHDPVQDRLIGMVGFKLLPLSFIGVGHDHRIDIHQPVAAWRRDDLFLSRGDHTMEIFDFVFEDLDKFDHPTIANIERPVKF